MNDEKKHDICKRCKHYPLPPSELWRSVEACDSPEYKMEDRCFTFRRLLRMGDKSQIQWTDATWNPTT